MSVPSGISARVTELNAEVERLTAERDQLEAALFECAKLSGADVSDGPPGWPDIATWAVEEVGQARRDCDEGADEDRAVRVRVAELEARIAILEDLCLGAAPYIETSGRDYAQRLAWALRHLSDPRATLDAVAGGDCPGDEDLPTPDDVLGILAGYETEEEAEMAAEARVAEARVAELEAALGWYAEQSWDTGEVPYGHGQRAREALDGGKR